jgi:hypothetical protein
MESQIRPRRVLKVEIEREKQKRRRKKTIGRCVVQLAAAL